MKMEKRRNTAAYIYIHTMVKKNKLLPVAGKCRNLKSCWVKNYNLFNLLADKKLPTAQKRALIQQMTDQQILDFSRLVKDFCCKGRRVKLTSREKNKLMQDKTFFQKMVSKKVPMGEKRAVIEQKGGFLPFLLPILAAVAGKPLIKMVGKSILGGVAKNVIGGIVHSLAPKN